MRTRLEAAWAGAVAAAGRFRFNSLAFRLFATLVLWTLIVLPISGFIIYYNYSQNVIEDFESRLKLYLISIEAQNTESAVPVKPEYLGESGFSFPNSGWYWQIQPVTEGEGKRVVSDSLATGELPSPLARKTKSLSPGLRTLDIFGPDGQSLRLFEQIGRVGNDPNGPRYSFIVAGPLDWPNDRISTFALQLTAALGIAALGLLAATLFQVRFGLFPLRTIEKGLSDIRSGKADKLDGELPLEIEPLQVELNALINSNQEIIERARTQVGNLAHALKTPLAVITNEADDDQSAFSKKVAEQADLMRTQITHYLDRARVAARVGTVGRVTKVHDVCEALQRALERIYRDKGVSISLKGTDHVLFQGEQHDLEEMLGNLLDNACKWCSGRVILTARAMPRKSATDPAMFELCIEDDGPGLSEAQRNRIGERGVRLDESTPGSGLGLSIVRDFAKSYRGDFRLERSDLGGLKAVVRLPAAKAVAE